jgi:hypothetical protein
LHELSAIDKRCAPQGANRRRGLAPKYAAGCAFAFSGERK